MFSLYVSNEYALECAWQYHSLSMSNLQAFVLRSSRPFPSQSLEACNVTAEGQSGRTRGAAAGALGGQPTQQV